MCLSILTGTWKYYVCCCGRNFGKTDLTIEAACMLMLNYNNCKVYYISQNYKLSKEIFNSIKDKFGIAVFGSISGEEITLINGSRIIFFSYDKWDGLRGHNHADFIFLDEAAKLPNDAWNQVVQQICYTPSKVIMLSTPRGKNWFYEQYLNTFNFPNQFVYLSGTTFDNPFIPETEKEIIRSYQGTNLYLQETLAQFIDSGGEVFSKVNELFALDSYASYKNTYGGADIARKTDSTVQYVFSEKKELVFHNSFSGVDYDRIDTSFETIFKKYNTKMLIEANNVGDPVCERLEKRFRSNIERWITTESNKQKLIQELIYTLEHEEIKLLKLVKGGAMEKVKHELNIYEYRLNERGGITYSAPKGSHDDEVMALALANHKLNETLKKGTFKSYVI
jgi:PBSX family phage terminase large subunit